VPVRPEGKSVGQGNGKGKSGEGVEIGFFLKGYPGLQHSRFGSGFIRVVKRKGNEVKGPVGHRVAL